MNTKQLFLIGGKEDKGDRPLLLEEFCKRFNPEDGPLVLITGASKIPLEVGEIYTKILTDWELAKLSTCPLHAAVMLALHISAKL